MIELQQLSVQQQGATLLHNISYTLPAGMTGIIGRNGAGKSTLLKIMAGIITPTAGQVLYDGAPLSSVPRHVRAAQIAYLPQHPALAWNMCVADVVALGVPVSFAVSGRHHDAVSQILEVMGIAALHARAFNSLSGGEQQKVMLARALVGNPKLLLLDEPVNHLDACVQLQLLELLQQKCHQSMVIAVVLHDITHAIRMCDQLLVLDNGRVKTAGIYGKSLKKSHIDSILNIKSIQHMVDDTPCVVPWTAYES